MTENKKHAIINNNFVLYNQKTRGGDQLGTKQIIRQSNGAPVTLISGAVDRVSGKVVIKIPEYNAFFIFTKGKNVLGKEFAVIEDRKNRKAINPEKESVKHVSKTVYREMAKWAWAILSDQRQV